VHIGSQWVHVDVAGNDGTPVNAALLVPDTCVCFLYIENKEYMVDRYAGSYTSDTFEYEYYTSRGLYYFPDKIAEQLWAGLDKDGKVTLRTHSDITGDQVQRIHDYLKSKTDKEYRWYFSMGVVCVAYV